MIELPQIDEPPRERADAARNRERILHAAGELVATCGIDGVSMEDVAKAACVGTGTLYRRFGDRAGLAYALLDEQTRDFQNALIAGPPPLGPGAPAAERLQAFGAGFIELLEGHAALMAAASPAGRGGERVHAFFGTHLKLLLQEAAPELNADFTAEALLATLAPAHHLRLRERYSLAQMVQEWCALVQSVTRR
jgi:AcrR family transcriptional regulator